LKKLLYILLFFGIATPSVLWAKHIVGGEITYKLKSTSPTSNRYEFTMRIYRDCNAANAAPYDNIAAIAAHLKKAGGRPIDARANLGVIQKVTAPKIECLIPPDVCVQEGVYIWTMDLPKVADTYVVMYSRCCRNESITNINRPGTVGASYVVEITETAQQRGNDSPVFKSFPPIVICGNYPINFDHSATDADGDQLVYSFCEPYAGGGQTGGTACDNTSPNPPCWPPFGTISYKLPNYSYQRPVGGNPIVSINANTGMITGTPTEQGQYVVSVCVEEYTITGKLLSVIKRDFQFNVERCDPVVQASVKADTVINKTYYVSACGEKVLSIVNRSLDQRYITDYRFDVDLKTEKKTYKEWQPTIQFPDTGVYKGNLFLNPGTVCADTINLQFNIFSTLSPNFTFKYDTCIAGPISFKETSLTPNGRAVSWKWDFGDGKIETSQNPSHLYATPGKKNIRLYVKDNIGCERDTVRSITWLPVPPLIIIQPSTFVGCTPAKLTFKNLSTPIDSTYDIRWKFGDGGVSNAISPTYTYANAGTYNISVEIASPIGCKTGKTFSDWIKVNPGTKADFSFLPEQVTKIQNAVSFTDKSLGANRWQWFFGNQGYSPRQNPVFSFKDTGIQKIKLLVNNQYGCLDSMVKSLDVIPVVSFFLPNAFTPNDDAVNEYYKGVGITDGMNNFTMKIWNRWGELIYESANPSEGWNGKKFNTGEDSPQGVYLCVVNYVSPRGQNFEIRSYANLIR
jgi:gliding motility-associated-like protein